MQKPEWQKIKEVFNQTLDLPPDEREKILAKLDSDLRNEVLGLIKSSEEAENFINEPAAVDFNFGQELAAETIVGSYKIIESIGFGGMGAVYLAERTDLGQKVALKLIKRGMDTREVLKRFNLERQILSRLNHPNIARLLDAGSTADGLPYFVMEYIEGESIIKFCDSHDFDINERLEVFRKVCTAISYAHQNLIVHRDIKPSNIIVTNDGTPKLLDFGIAKLLDNENENTATQARIFTPEYASPEQINGLPITTATDVYSLGVVLYQLLSGIRPFTSESRNYAEIAKLVLSVEPPKPSSVVSGRWSVVRNTAENEVETQNEFTKSKLKTQNSKLLSGDLDNIILKSIRKEPERRYQSVSDFSEDIKRHLNGLPVSATADSTRYRVSKFVQRHKQGVAIGSIVGLLILSISGVAIWQAIVANQERAKAEARFNDVRKLAKTVLFDYHDEIEKLVGSTPLRAKIVKDALGYLDRIAIESEDNPELQKEIADAYQKAGDVQGNPAAANLGDERGALESYTKAFSIREKLFANDETNLDKKVELAKSYESMGRIFDASGELEKSKDHYEKAVKLCKETADKPTLARIYQGLGLTQQAMGDLQGALDSYQERLRLAEELLVVDPTSELNRRRISVVYSTLGDVYFDLGDIGKSEEHHQIAYKKMQELSSSEPTNRVLSRGVAIDMARLGTIKNELGKFTEAISLNQAAINVLREHSLADPENEQAKDDLTSVLGNLAETYEKMTKFTQAEAIRKEIISIQKVQFNDADGRNFSARARLAASYSALGAVSLKLQKNEIALANYKMALEILKNIALEGDSITNLAVAYEGMGDALLSGSKNSLKRNEAVLMYQQSLEVWTTKEAKNGLAKKDVDKPREILKKIYNLKPKS